MPLKKGKKAMMDMAKKTDSMKKVRPNLSTGKMDIKHITGRRKGGK